MNEEHYFLIVQKRKKYIILSDEWKHFAYFRNLVCDAMKESKDQLQISIKMNFF